MPDNFPNYVQLDSPAEDFFPITPNDSVDLSEVTRSIWVTGAGNLTVITRKGQTRTWSSVPANTLLPIRVSRVLTTGTTATGILGLV